MENSMECPQEIKNKTTYYNMALLLLVKYLKETKSLSQKDICTPILIAALFKIAKLWEKTKCPSTEE